MFICGSRCCGHEDKNITPNSPPKRSKKGKILRRLIGKDSSKKNPYAEVGLDKFHALLADLEDKPIIVRVKNNKSNNNNVLACNHADMKMDGRKEIGDEWKEKGTAEEAVMKTRRRWKGRLRRSYYCNIGVVVVLILVFLTIFGRSFAILCTTIAWYLVPQIVGGGSSSLSSRRKSMRNVGWKILGEICFSHRFV